MGYALHPRKVKIVTGPPGAGPLREKAGGIHVDGPGTPIGLEVALAQVLELLPLECVQECSGERE